MDQSTRKILGEAADQVLDLAEQMIHVGEKLNKLTGATVADVRKQPAEEPYVDWTDRYRFEREAKEELAELIRAIETAPK